MDDAVDVTLLVGPPDGCQDEVFDALRRYASGSATWLATEAVAPCAAAESVRELAHALASVRSAAARSDGGPRGSRIGVRHREDVRVSRGGGGVGDRGDDRRLSCC